MQKLQTFWCASVVLAVTVPSLLRAQPAQPEVPRAAGGNELRLFIPSSVRLYSLGIAPRALGPGLLRGRLQDSLRTDRPVPIMLRLDSIAPSALECPMPIARMAPADVPRMPVAQVDSVSAPPRVVAWRACANPLDRR